MIKEITVEDLERDNFKPDEFFRSETADRLSIDNTTDNYLMLENLYRCADLMQEIRELLAFPIRITSGYRCEALNDVVGGVRNSQHINGEAIDFICPKFGTPENIVRYIKERGVEVDQCIVENNSWVHVSIRHKDNRNQFLVFNNNQYSILA